MAVLSQKFKKLKAVNLRISLTEGGCVLLSSMSAAAVTGSCVVWHHTAKLMSVQTTSVVHMSTIIPNKLWGRPPQYVPAPASCLLTFWTWKRCPSHVWHGLPLCQF